MKYGLDVLILTKIKHFWKSYPIMQTIRILPNVRMLLKDGRIEEAADIINAHIDILAPHIEKDIWNIKSDTPKISLCASRVHFVLGNYKEAIEHAICAKDLFVDDGSFYYRSIIHHMMDSAEVHEDSEVRRLILELMEREAVSSSSVGYLFSVGAYDLFKKALKRYIHESEDYRELLEMLISIAEEEDCAKEMYKAFVEIGLEKKPFIFYIVDAYFYLEEIDKARELIERLSEEDILLCYEVALYVEDNCFPDIEVHNEKVMSILCGKFKERILSSFLLEKNITNFKFLESVARVRTPYLGQMNSLMNLKTGNDTFYRNNTETFGLSREWAKFFEIASLGMIHSSSSNPYELLKNHLPSEISQNDSGALMALGLIKAKTFSQEDTEFLLYFIDTRNVITPELAQGACFGIGLVNLGLSDEELLGRLRNISKSEQTLVVEAAVYGMGMIGSNSWNVELLEDLKAISMETEFERVKRAAGVAFSLVIMLSGNTFYDEKVSFIEKESKNYINELVSDKNAISRCSGVLAIGSAFVGTGKLSVISQLLSYTNDEDDDVKRTAVLAIALVCCDDRDLLVGTLEPLSENHNFFVRAGVALSIGVFLAGTGDEYCCDILEALMYDNNGLVKQAACIGIGFVIMQCNPSLVRNYKRIVERLNKLIVDRKEDPSTELGAVFGRGVSEAGGRNIVFSVRNMSGIVSPDRVAGIILFFHYWYSYILMNMISLCYLPTPIFCFNENLEEEDIEIVSSDRYDNLLIRLPETKKTRRLRPRQTEDREILTKSSPVLKSGCRCTIIQRDECGLSVPPILFVKKK